MTQVLKTSPFQILELLRGKHPDFSARVQELSCSTPTGLVRTNVRFYYLTFRDGLPSTTEFVEYLRDQLIYFCIPKRERNQVEQLIAADQSEMYRLIPKLHEKAKTLFIEAKKGKDRTGEPGELVLFVLLEWALRAPQIVSKMHLKTNRNMPVHGTDGIHARLDNSGNLVLYFGESKFHKDFADGLSDALTTAKETHENYSAQSRELDLVRDHHSFGADEQQLISALLDYLDYRSPKSNQYSRCFACLIGFEFAAYQKTRSLGPGKAEVEFVRLCTERIESAIPLIGDKVKERGLDTLNFEFFVVPFESLSELRAKFYEVTGIR